MKDVKGRREEVEGKEEGRKDDEGRREDGRKFGGRKMK